MKPCRKCGGTNFRIEPTRRVCRTCRARWQKQNRKRNPEENLYFLARRRARVAGLPFELTQADVRSILADWTCVYCESPVGSFEGVRPTSATLDRLIPAAGYIHGNTVLACHRCNAAKAEHTPATLREWADRIEAVINRQHPHEE